MPERPSAQGTRKPPNSTQPRRTPSDKTLTVIVAWGIERRFVESIIQGTAIPLACLLREPMLPAHTMLMFRGKKRQELESRP
jgi:hypothetical protein